MLLLVGLSACRQSFLPFCNICCCYCAFKLDVDVINSKHMTVLRYQTSFTFVKLDKWFGIATHVINL